MAFGSKRRVFVDKEVRFSENVSLFETPIQLGILKNILKEKEREIIYY